MQDPELRATDGEASRVHPTDALSRRQRQVVELIALGLETPAIANELHISQHTVRAHVGNAMDRIGARTRAHLVALVLREQPLNAKDPGCAREDNSRDWAVTPGAPRSDHGGMRNRVENGHEVQDPVHPAATDALLEAADVAILGVDLEGRLVHANRRARALLALGEPLPRSAAPSLETLRIRTRSGLTLLDGSSRPPIPPIGEAGLAGEVLVDTAAGSLMFRARANSVHNADGAPLGSVLVLEDATDPQARCGSPTGEPWEQELARRAADALPAERLELFSQPIVDIASGRTALAELLLRVRGADGALAGPCEFLRAAELHETIAQIDAWVVEQAVRVASRGPVAVNVSALTVSRPAFLEVVERSLDRERVAPHMITFELTETAVVSDMVTAARFAERLNEIGCHFALDDFGTGYGALTYMKLLPIQYLKIDRDFVGDIATNRRSRTLVSGIVHLADEFGQRTIAEGVEDEQTIRILGELGVHMAQGFFLGVPAPV